MEWLKQLFSSGDAISKVIGFVLTILSARLLPYFQPRPIVVWGISHGFTFRIRRDGSKPDTFLVYTGSVFVQNIGRETARDIEVHLNYAPQVIEIWPSFDFEKSVNPEGRFIVRIKSLGPKESLTIEMLSEHVKIPDTLRVRSPQGDARQVPLRTAENVPNWKIRIVLALLLLGAFTFFQYAALVVVSALT